jgi:PhoPQ-activated pathogenicity-related protein
MWPVLASVASKNKAIVALLKQVPNQPLYGGKTEDELISYTLHQFKQDKDYSWPLLFPMVKSAVKAMDAVQEFSARQLNHKVNNFTVSGASKRGWTTWLSSAIDDKRVKAIAPIVIDMLNMPKTLSYQLETYGEYSIQIEDQILLTVKLLRQWLTHIHIVKNIPFPKLFLSVLMTNIGRSMRLNITLIRYLGRN